jgi:hypothetical protein
MRTYSSNLLRKKYYWAQNFMPRGKISPVVRTFSQKRFIFSDPNAKEEAGLVYIAIQVFIKAFYQVFLVTTLDICILKSLI